MKYCEFCGKEIEENAHCSCAEAVEQQNKRKNNIKKYGVIGGIIAVIVIVILLIAGAGSHSVSLVDPFQYTEVEFEGFDTLGTVSVSFNRDAFIEALIGEEPNTDNEDEIRKWYVKYETYSDAIKYSYTPEGSLSNGNTVEVKFSFGEVLQGKVAKAAESYTVSGLQTVETVDFFKDISVTFEGLSGDGEAIITVNSDSEVVNSCRFNYDRYGLNNGESLEISIGNVDDLLDSYAVVPLETSKTYEVSGLSKFVTSVEDIPVETVKEFADRFVKETNDSVEDDFMFTHTEAEFYKAYLLVKREDTINFWEPDNKLEIYVHYDSYIGDELHSAIYTPLLFENISVSPDGELNITYEDGRSTFGVDDMENYEDSEVFYVYEIQ